MRYRHLKYIIFGVTAILIISIFSNYFHNSPFTHDNKDDINDLDQVENLESPVNPKIATNEPNGMPLVINQYANITKHFTDVSSNENVSFPILPGWTSKNATINYEGVSRQKQWATNEQFTDNANSWDYVYNDTIDNPFWDGGHVDWDVGGHIGLVYFGMSAGSIPRGNYAGYQQNISITGEALSTISAIGSFDYYYDPKGDYPNANLFLAISINGVEKKVTIPLEDITMEQWGTLSVQYDAIAFGQTLPGDISLLAGIEMNEDTSHSQTDETYLDNIKLTLWTELNNTDGIIKTYDAEFNQNYTYSNIDYGKGFSFIDRERFREISDNIIFTVYENISQTMDFLDFNIDMVIITSPAIKQYNSTILNQIGSRYTLGDTITWEIELTISSFPEEYVSWIKIDKPNDWSFFNIIDSYEVEKIDNCLGTGFGSNKLIIPSSEIIAGKWKLKANSSNYIAKGNVGVWSNPGFIEYDKLTFEDIFQINITLNNSIILPNTRVNCTIYYPNNTVLWHGTEEPNTYNYKIGNFTVGKNMTVGNYRVEVIWTNNQSYLNRYQVGYIEIGFIVWHHTNLTAVNSYFELIAGDPLLLKVKYNDGDFNDTIAFATINYNSTFGASGQMIYQGLGIYFAEINTNSLGLGNYYFSFNASKHYYENKTRNNLVLLQIIAQPLALKVPSSAVSAMGNNYAICRVNVTGALTSTLLWPANVSSDWKRGYSVTPHDNGTFTINFSTNGIPTQGILQSFTINVFANKTDYGSTFNFITLIVYPVPTAINVNKSLHNVYLNEVFYVKINYTIQSSGLFISGANCTITWLSNYLVVPVSDGYIVRFDTVGLSLDAHAALITIKHVGYETEYTSVTAIVSEQDVTLTVLINAAEISENSLIDLYFKESINISVRAWALGDAEYLSGDILSWISDNYQISLIESPPTYFNASITMNAADFTNGINNINIQFQLENYTTTLFSFQLFLNEQEVNLTVYINTAEISENTLIDLYFQEKVNISARAFALAEKIYLSGGLITIISDHYEENLTESPNTYFNLSIIMDGAYFNPGINYVYLLFQQGNYSTKTFSFQLFIRTQSVNLTLLIDAEQVQENYLVETFFNDILSLSSRAYAEAQHTYLANCTITFINNNYEKNLTKTVNYWYNTSIEISTSDFKLGINYVYLRFTRTNYTTVTFSFQILVNQISIDVDFIDIEDSIEAFAGETITIEIKLTEGLSGLPIEGADISYDWEYGVGEFEEKDDGVYEVELEIPENIEGNYDLELIITTSGSMYKSSEEDLTITVNERELPEYWIWIIIAALSVGVGLLAAISLRAYVFLPGQERKNLNS